MKSALAARVNALSDITTTSKLGVEALKVEVQLYERAMDRAGRFLDLLAKSGIEERRQLITEAQAQLAFQFMNRVFDAIELTPEQRALLPTVVPRELERMQSEQLGRQQ